MKNKKLFALILTVVLLATQFAMLGTVSATTAALSGRNDFAYGVAIHHPDGYEAYTKQFDTILDAEALGANLVRTGAGTDTYDKAFATLAGRHGINVMFHTSLDITFLNGSSMKTPSQIGYDAFQAVYTKFYNKATALKDFNAYIQIGNELDVEFENYQNNLSSLAIAVYCANKGVQDANTATGGHVKTVVNFSYHHYDFLQDLKKVKINPSTYTTQSSSSGAVYADWDVVGWDYYSNMYDRTTYQSILPSIKSAFSGKSIIVCESNLTPTSRNNNGTINYEENASWLESFVRYCYNDSRVIGFCAYELYDEPHFESDQNFHKEAHYGLIDANGNKKDTYNTICALYGGTGTVASRTVSAAPAYPSNADIEISRAGVSTTFTSTYINTSNRLSLDFTAAPVNLLDVGQFEFDLYIEDYDDFLLTNPANGGTRINFALASSTIKTQTRIRFDIADQITQDGWNHIVLKKSDRWQVDSSFTYSSVKWAMIYFQDGGSEYNPISGAKVAIANLCGTSSEIDRAPAYPANAVVELSREGKKNTWGTNYNNTGDRLYVATASTVDLSAVDQIEFDIYIEDLAAFQSAWYPKNPRFYVSSGDSRGSNRSAYAYYSQITQSGWNHVVFDKTNTTSSNSADFSSIKWVGLNDWSGSTSANPVGSTEVRFANVCGTMSEINQIPDWPEYEYVGILKSNTANWWGSSGNNSNHIVTGLPDTDMHDTEQVEFDVYIDNYEGLMSEVGDGAIRFRFGSAGDNYIDVNVKNKITHDGWNHVTAVWLSSSADSNTDRYSLTGDPVLGAIRWVKLYCTKGINSSACGKTRIANVCFTKKPINRLPEWPEYEHVEILKSNTADWWGGANSSNHIVTGLTETDMSDTEQVEFDVYIDNYEGFVSQTASGNVLFRFGSQGDNYIDVNVKSKITHQGWNHVVAVWLPSSADSNTDRASLTGSPVLTAIRWVKLYSTVAIAWDACGRTRIANVCFTKKPINRIPAWPSYEHVEILKSNTANWWGSSANNGNHLVTGLPETDISATQQVEFDVYIDNYAGLAAQTASGEIRFRFGSQGDNYIDVNVKDKITGDGWNHVVATWVDSSVDPDTDRDSVTGSPALTAIRWVKLYSSVGINGDVVGKTRIANVCFTTKMGQLTVPTDVMALKTASFIGAVQKTVKFDAEGYYDVALADAANLSGARMFELDVYLADNTVEALTVELIDGNGDSVYHEFENLTTGWNHLALRLSDVEGDGDISGIYGYTLQGVANASIVVSNFYAADYADGDANRDGVCDILDLIRAKKFVAGTATAGNLLAMDLADGDYDVDAGDLTALTGVLLA